MSTIVRTDESPGRRADLVQDESRLERLGYEQELKRNFSKFETFGVAFRYAACSSPPMRPTSLTRSARPLTDAASPHHLRSIM
jgi:hypothetical protein